MGNHQKSVAPIGFLMTPEFVPGSGSPAEDRRPVRVEAAPGLRRDPQHQAALRRDEGARDEEAEEEGGPRF